MTLRRIQLLAVVAVFFILFLSGVGQTTSRGAAVRPATTSKASRLDVRGLLDAVLVAPLQRYLPRPAGRLLDLSRMRHNRQSQPGQMQPDQPGRRSRGGSGVHNKFVN